MANELENNTAQFENILTLDPENLLEWLNDNFFEDIPTTITSTEDLRNAGTLLGKLTNIYSYLVSLSMFAKLKVREAKKDKENKENIDKAIDRKEIINSYAEIIKCQYNAVSRMVTVKKQIDEEMKMI
jgi:hypothetical protein